MSDSIDWVVDLEATSEHVDGLASRVKHWLIEQQIVLTKESGVRAYSGATLLPPGPCAEAWSVQVARDLAMCGLEVVTKRTVFHTGDNGLDGFQCPNCGQSHGVDDVPWSDAVGGWWSQEGSHLMLCPSCQRSSSIVEWRFLEFEWGFGNLGFGFNNWPISERLAAEIGAVLGHRCRLVHQHI